MNTFFVRLGGCGVLMFSSALCAKEVNSMMKKRISAIDEIVRLISFSRRKIEYYGTPVPQIFASFSSEIFDRLGFSLINAENKPDVSCLPLSEEEKGMFAEFLSGLGKSYTDGEVKHCSDFSEYFGERSAFLKSEYPKKAKVRNSMALLLGASAAIFLL